jgi:tRNA-2-methylthio-N6-dimethylallyladenosine synthase
MHEGKGRRMDGMTYHIWTIGCQMNEADTRRVAGALEARGLRAVERAEEADLVVLNTCVVRQSAEDKAEGRLRYARQLKQRRPGVAIALMGCLVGKGGSVALRERFPFVDVFVPPSDLAPLIEHLRRIAERDGRPRPETDDFLLPERDRHAVTAYVPVVLGCSHACTYCIIPYRRGPERSRPMGEVLDEAQKLAEQGIRELVLLGQIVDRYGLDRPEGENLPALLRAVAGIVGIARVRFLTSHPAYLSDDLIRTVAACDGICPHFEVPAQAGDDGILRAMRRGYTSAEYRGLVARIRGLCPDAAVHTDLIVGFPGETEAQFEETVRLVRDLRFDKIHLAQYSVRPQTYAARKLADDVPAEEKQRRWAVLDELQRSLLEEKQKDLEGRTVDVLVDGFDDRHGRWRGRTPQDKPAFFTAPGADESEDLLGRVMSVRVETARPYSLVGVADESRAP